ncbi:MAG TPA: outer membrane beta-barrel protein [Candidatus Sulfotelmatobacter sp.]|nr:outer membrane beta-barrel protein [Candidatus Sulfotelmatobacter sp.]
MHPASRRTVRLADRALIGGVVFIVALLLGMEMAHAAEIIPAVGVSRNADGSGSAKLYTGLSVRTSIIPMVKADLGVAYHTDEVNAGVFTTNATTWPVTLSAWLAPIPFVYAGGGVGWYHTSYSIPGAPGYAAAAATNTTFGTHIGGGFQMPLVPMLSLDLNARYVMLKKSDDSNLPSNYDPKFWSTALGLAIKF